MIFFKEFSIFCKISEQIFKDYCILYHLALLEVLTQTPKMVVKNTFNFTMLSKRKVNQIM